MCDKTYRPWPQNPANYQQANVDPANNPAQKRTWNYSLFDCFEPSTLCLTGCCLPCLTFGKTQARLQDPRLQGFGYVNGDCMIFTFLGFIASHWIFQTIRRGEMRDRLGIEGSCCGDCCVSVCCSCCAIVQEEKEAELRLREEYGQGYRGMEPMRYR